MIFQILTSRFRWAEKLIFGFLLLSLLLLAANSSAHHSFGIEFDINSPIDLTGKVVKVELINPHSWIHIAVADEAGNEEVWMIEGGSPSALFRQGVNRNTVPIGAVLKVSGYIARDGSNHAAGEVVTFEDGSPLFSITRNGQR